MNIRPFIVINGKNSQSIQGLLISELAPISKPPIRTRIETVDGRDGDIVTTLGYEAYDKVIKIGLANNYNVDDVIDYFNSSGVVSFSNEPDKYYRFAIYNQIDFERLIRFKTAEVTFHVQPFKFSDSEGTKKFTFDSVTSGSLNIRNNGNIYSRPTIAISGSGDINISLNGAQILTLNLGNPPQKIIIDSEKMNAYSEDGILLNRLIVGDYDNIKLNVGQNTISFTGSVSEIDINLYSRWI